MKKLIQIVKDFIKINRAYLFMFLLLIVAFVAIEAGGGIFKGIQLNLLHFKDIARLTLRAAYYGGILFSLMLLFCRKRFILPILILFLYAILAYVNWLYFKFFDSYMPLTMYTEFQQLNGLGASIFSLMDWWDLLYLVIPILVLVIYHTIKSRILPVGFVQRFVIGILVVGLLYVPMFGMSRYVMKRSDVPSLQNAIARVIECQPSAAYRFFGLIPILQYQIQRYIINDNLSLTEEEKTEIRSFIESHRIRHNKVAEGLPEFGRENLVIILMESFNTSCIHPKIMPTVDSLSRLSTTLYAPQIKQMTQGCGSIGGQFVVLSGLSGLRPSAFCIDYPNNKYPSIARELKNKTEGIHSSTIVCTPRNFWRQDVVNQSLSVDSLYGQESFGVDVNGWVGDELVFDFAKKQLSQDNISFFNLIVPGDMHFPYHYNEHILCSLDYEQDGMTAELHEYYRRAKYVDMVISDYITHLKSRGLYDETLLVITSDHQAPMDKFGEVEISDYFPALFVNTGMDCSEYNAQNKEIVFCHNQVYPTMLHLMNLTPDEYAGMVPSMFDLQETKWYNFDNLEYGEDEQITYLYDIQEKMIRSSYWGTMY